MVVGASQTVGQPQTSGKAIASLIFGIAGLLCVMPVIGPIIAVILGHMSKSEIKASGGAVGGEGLALGGLITGYMGLLAVPMVVVIMAGMMLPVLSQARDKARRVNDAGNLKQIGLACLMFSGDHEGYYPDNLADLVEQNYIQLGPVWVCPATSTTPPASVDEIRDGSGTDYVYVGAGLKDDVAEAHRTVIMYTAPGSFHGKWMNFLFADGHVEGAAVESAQEAAEMKGWIIANQQ